jgi:hypothetical protein
MKKPAIDDAAITDATAATGDAATAATGNAAATAATNIDNTNDNDDNTNTNNDAAAAAAGETRRFAHLNARGVRAVAAAIAKHVTPGWTLLLYGGVGVGKSAFARGR